MLPFSFAARVLLLDRDLAYHAEGKMRGAVERVLTRLDIRKRDRDALARVHLERARQLSLLLGDVRVELRLDVGWNLCRVEGDVVRAA